MQKHIIRKATVLVLSAGLLLSDAGYAQSASGSDSKPKFIGPLLWTVASSVAQQAMPSFVNWLTGAQRPDGGGGAGLAPVTSEPSTPATSTQVLGQAVVTSISSVLSNALGVPQPPQLTPNSFAPVSNPVILGQPDIPLRADQSNGSNYQGLHLAVMGVDSATNAMRYRALADGFRSGERFKLRLVSTFDAVVYIDAINPLGVRKRLYPDEATADQVVLLKAGQPVLLPLAPNQYFEFTDQIGQERLVITVRDPRGMDGSTLSSQPVYRTDEAWGSNMVQLTPPGTFAGFSQQVSFMHTAPGTAR